jgi:hypothetical protein
MLTRLSGSRSRPSAAQKIWWRRETNPVPLGLQRGTLTTRPQRRSWTQHNWMEMEMEMRTVQG